MSTFKAPNDQGYFRQINQGDVFGELWGTFGIDLSSSIGKLKTSKRLAPILSTTQTNNDNIEAFCLYAGKTYAFATGGRRIYIESYRNPRISGSWTSTSGSLDIGQETDAVVFDGKMLVSTGTNIASTTNGTTYDDDWWTTVSIGGETGSALTTAKPHVMDVSRIGLETLFVTDGNLVHYANTTSGHSTVTLPAQLTACCLATDAFATWVGTYSSQGDAYVYEIYVGEQLNGTSIARNSYRIKGSAVLSMDVIDGVPYIVTDKGHIQTFNGRAFVTIARFPFAMDGVTISGMSLGDIEADNLARAIHPKGMRASDRSLFININTDNELIVDLAANPLDDDDIFENVVVNPRSPSGIWEYNLDTQILNHRYPFTNATTQNGFHRHQSSGPILILDNQYSKLLAAGRVQSDRTDIYAEDPDGTPFGYFITPEIQSSSVLEAWEKLAIKKDVLNGETISVKYRTTAFTPIYKQANWSAADEFVIAEDVASSLADGYLVEVLDGYGAGKIAHINEDGISNSTSTTTVKLDTSIGSAGQSNYVRIWNFKTFAMEDNVQHDTGGLSDPTEWVQFMVVLNGMVTIRQILSKGTVTEEM